MSVDIGGGTGQGETVEVFLCSEGVKRLAIDIAKVRYL